jgi:CMP-N-acetylneuraminic acid synthetase
VLEGGRLTFHDPAGSEVIARQQLTPIYHRNGAAYAITRECLLSQKSILGKNAGAVVLDEPMLSIDTLEDFETVEAVLRVRKNESR